MPPINPKDSVKGLYNANEDGCQIDGDRDDLYDNQRNYQVVDHSFILNSYDPQRISLTTMQFGEKMLLQKNINLLSFLLSYTVLDKYISHFKQQKYCKQKRESMLLYNGRGCVLDITLASSQHMQKDPMEANNQNLGIEKNY